MDYYGSQLGRLIEQLSSLPGIGSKTAQRLAFHIVNMPVEKVQALSDSIISAKKNVRYCKECFTMTDQELCPICGNPKRNHRMIMVVETPVTWPPMRRRANTTASTMCCTEPFPRCWASARATSA